MTTVATTPPPGQLALWWPNPTRRQPKSLRVVTVHGQSEAIRDLPVATGRAAAAADVIGEAWLLADDGTFAHVDRSGDVNPSTGWAAMASRVIANQRTTP